ncbi:MAG: GntR family transcriptional regulator [Burkholderiaceae bacterium]|jgi:DNA-binding GntR family transcriptional regulator
MTKSLIPIEKNTLSDLAYEELKKALLSGRFRPGEKILLRDIAKELQISLTPVRDAVNHLIAERVLDRGPGGQKGGASIPALSSSQFEQLTALRADLESNLARTAAQRITAGQIQDIERLAQEMKKTMKKGNKSSYLDLHRRFHFSLYDASEMDVVKDITEILWLRCGPALNAVLPDYVPNLKQRDYHQEAVDALKKGDNNGVADSIRADITIAGTYITQLMRQNEQKP